MDLIQTQIAFFFKTDFKKDFEWFSLTLKETFGRSNQTLQIPIGDNEPSELPRLTLSYNGFSFNVAKNRLDVIILDKKMYKDVVERVVGPVLTKLELKIGRLGFVKTYFVPSNISILKKVLNEELQKRNYKEINIRLNEEFLIDGITCNNIEKIDLGAVQKIEGNGVKKEEGLIIQRDINTNQDIEMVFSEKQIHKFIEDFDNIANDRLITL